MPGEVRQPTRDDLEKLELFPFPTSARVSIRQVAVDRYILDCTDLNGTDLQGVEAFFSRMDGPLRAFRFKSRNGQLEIPHCRFDNETVTFNHDAPNRGSVRFALKVLPYKI